MSIIVPSNHTRIGAWVNSKGRFRPLKVWKIIPDLLCQLVEVNGWKREPRSNEYDTPRDILNTFFGMFEPSGLIMNATDKTSHKKAATRCQ